MNLQSIAAKRNAELKRLEEEVLVLRKQLRTARECIERRDVTLKAAKAALIKCGGWPTFLKLMEGKS